MRPRALVALLLVLVLASLTPLARLSPPDPTWFAGFWDDGDYDNIVLLICGTAAPPRGRPPRPAPRPRSARPSIPAGRSSRPSAAAPPAPPAPRRAAGPAVP